MYLLDFRNLSADAPKLRSWFGPNGQFIKELPCPSCRGRGYTECTECGIERPRLDCLQCNGKVNVLAHHHVSWMQAFLAFDVWGVYFCDFLVIML